MPAYAAANTSAWNATAIGRLAIEVDRATKYSTTPAAIAATAGRASAERTSLIPTGVR